MEHYIKAKYLCRPVSAPNAVIKNQAAKEPLEGYYPAYSASGQDVWLPNYDFDTDAIILSAVGARCGKTFVAHGKFGLCANTHTLIVDTNKVNINYLQYILNNEDWWKKGGSAQPFVLVNDSLNQKIYYPAMNKQTRIANFLDKKVSEIDAVISKTKESIEEYKKLKQSVIIEAVTKGLDPNVEMRDSKVKWIGKIPVHWKGTPKLKLYCNLESGGTPSREHPEYWNGNINWIKTGELQNNEIFDSEEKISELGLSNSSAKIFDKETILMALYGQGKTRGMTGLLMMPAATNQACAAIKQKKEIFYTRYLWCVLISAYDEIRTRAQGSGQPNLSLELVGNLEIPMPTAEEQQSIVAYLDSQCSKFDNLISKKEQVITELEQYKKYLIYEYVTGKREVPNANYSSKIC